MFTGRDVAAGLVGNIIHEAQHLFSFLRVLHRWSDGDKNYDEDTYSVEYNAKLFSTDALRQFGGTYSRYAVKIGYLTKNGYMVTSAIVAAATIEQSGYKTTGVKLLAWGVLK